MPEIAMPLPVIEVGGHPSPTIERLSARAKDAGNHLLLQHIRTGNPHAKEIAAWVQSRKCFAEYLAKKEVLVLAKVGDREARRIWTSRLLAIDGHGDFYGPSKQGLIETWRRLATELQPDGPFSQSSKDLIVTMRRHFDEHLRFMHGATWTEALGASIVDDWVVQNDWMTVAMRRSANPSAGHLCGGWTPLGNAEFFAHTLKTLDTQLGQPVPGELAGQALRSIETRVELEHAILNAAREFALRGQS